MPLPPFQITGFRFAKSDESSKQLSTTPSPPPSSSAGWTDIYLAYPREYDEVIDGAPQARLTYIDEESDKILVGSSSELVSRLEELIPDPSSPPSFPIVFQIAKPEGLQVWFVYLDQKKPIPPPLSLACSPKAVREKVESPTSDSSFLEAFERDLREALGNASPVSPVRDRHQEHAGHNDTASQASTQQNALNSDTVVQMLLGGMVNTLSDTLAPYYPGFRDITNHMQQNEGLKNAAEMLQTIGKVAESALQSSNRDSEQVANNVAGNVQEALQSVSSMLDLVLQNQDIELEADDPVEFEREHHDGLGSRQVSEEEEEARRAAVLAEHTCPICSEVLSRKFDMERHLRDRHGAGIRECPFCHERFSREHRYQRHMAKPTRRCPTERPSETGPVELATTEILEADSTTSSAAKETTVVERTPLVVDAEYPTNETEIDMAAFEEALRKNEKRRTPTVEDCSDAPEVAEVKEDKPDSTEQSKVTHLPTLWPSSSFESQHERPSASYLPPTFSGLSNTENVSSGSSSGNSRTLPPFPPPRHHHSHQHFHHTFGPSPGSSNTDGSPPSPPSRPPPPPPPPPRGLRKSMSMHIGNSGSTRMEQTANWLSPPCWGAFQAPPVGISRSGTEPIPCILESNVPPQFRYDGQQQRQPQEMPPSAPSLSFSVSQRHSVSGLRSDGTDVLSPRERAEFGPRVDRMRKAISMCKMQMQYQDDAGEGSSNSAAPFRPQRPPTRARWSSYISSTPATGDKEHESALYAGLEQLERKEAEQESRRASLSSAPPRPPRPEYAMIPDIAEDTSDADTIPLLSRRSSPGNDAAMNDELKKGLEKLFSDSADHRPRQRRRQQQPSTDVNDELRKGLESIFGEPSRQRQLRPQQSQPNMTQIGHGSQPQMMMGMGRDPRFRRPYPRVLPTPPPRPQPNHVNLFDVPSQPGSSNGFIPLSSSTPPPPPPPRAQSFLYPYDSLPPQGGSVDTVESRSINRCVNSLIEMGYGGDEGEDRVNVEKLTVVSNVAGGDVIKALAILEEDREARKGKGRERERKGGNPWGEYI
ncbi:hypothetical protein BJ508DRAFT_28644 [Ascobolus immersus RN42]|uniref:C2H2-type domain-containing protein n=1 Tax=Ascobolus immersus RN42 TaxID=1160509 RepID=A0A3N4HYY6_ASCIM|nr:hypothetical protein BJ508DRAFT_28644 [Ascobolus immersus RN42]